jgi:hypothetical protein
MEFIYSKRPGSYGALWFFKAWSVRWKARTSGIPKGAREAIGGQAGQPAKGSSSIGPGSNGLFGAAEHCVRLLQAQQTSAVEHVFLFPAHTLEGGYELPIREVEAFCRVMRALNSPHASKAPAGRFGHRQRVLSDPTGDNHVPRWLMW